MSKKIIKRDLSDCESIIMKIVWDTKEDIAVQELIKQLNVQYGKDYARTTVVTFLRKMSEKGFVHTYRVGNASFVHAEKTETDYVKQMMQDETDFWFSGKPSNAMASICDSSKVSKEEINRMRALLDELDS